MVALRFIETYQRREGFPPTIRQLADHMHLSSTATAHGYVERLERAGVVERVTERNGILRVTLLGHSVLNETWVAA